MFLNIVGKCLIFMFCDSTVNVPVVRGNEKYCLYELGMCIFYLDIIYYTVLLYGTIWYCLLKRDYTIWGIRVSVRRLNWVPHPLPGMLVCLLPELGPPPSPSQVSVSPPHLAPR